MSKKCNKIAKEFDVVVIGGGLAGMCAAIVSARQGCKTALIQDRPVLGGNQSSKMQVGISGAVASGIWNWNGSRRRRLIRCTFPWTPISS